MAHRSPRSGLTIVELIVLIAVLAFLIALVIPGPRNHGFLARVCKDGSGEETKYTVFVPHGYRGEKPYPLIFFLHGALDADRVTQVGIGPAIRPPGVLKTISKKEKEFPFFVVFPRTNALWDKDSEEIRRCFKVLDEVERDYRIDKQRVYLTGLSNGGTGTWYQAAKYPQRWAAIVPISGKGIPELAPQIKHIPCWCFHGDADRDFPVAEARHMIKALREAGGNPKYTEVESAGHNTWDDAYAKPELYQWMMKQKLP